MFAEQGCHDEDNMEKQIKKELPKVGNAEYVETVVNYLCRRKRSIEVDKIAKALGKTYIDPRRMIFYTTLGFLELSDGKLKVTRRGRELYKADSIERKQTIYLDVLRSIEEYRQVLGYKLNKPEERHLLVTDVLKYIESVIMESANFNKEQKAGKTNPFEAKNRVELTNVI
jgi:hypothetical protein